MPLVILTGNFISDSVSYVANDVINVPSEVVTWLTVTLSPALARAIASGPAAWSAGSYAINSLVTYGGQYYVNDASASSGDVPGVASKWVAVRYLPGSSVGSGGSSGGGSSIAADGNNYRIEGGTLYLKTPTAVLKQIGATDAAEGEPSAVVIS